MSEIAEVSEYHDAYAQTFIGHVEHLEADAARLNAPHIQAQADELRAAINDARDTSLRTMGVIP